YFQTPTVYTESVAVLFQTDAIEPEPAFEARIAGLFSGFHATEEGVEGFRDIGNHDLKNVAVDVFGIRAGVFETLDAAKLLRLGDAAAFQFIGVLAFRQQ